MKKSALLFMVIAALGSFSGKPQKDSDPAQVTLQNYTRYDLCLYLDKGDNLVCGPALANGGFCVTSVESGSHVFIVATADGKMSTSTDPVDVNSGDTKIVSAAMGTDGQINLSVR